MLLLVAAVIAWVLPALCDPRGLPIRGYGVMILSAVLAAMGLAVWRGRRVGVSSEVIFSLAFWMILPGILGARTIYVAEYWSEQYWPIYLEKGPAALATAMLNIANGGLVVYGAFFGGVAGLLLYVWKHRMPLLAVGDLAAPSLMLGLAIGRIGCLLNGCCYGGPCDLPWKISFPWGSPVHLHQVFDGESSLYGLKLVDGPRTGPVIEEVEPGSPAARGGLKPRQTIRRINGSTVVTAKDAVWALLNARRLNFVIRADDGHEIPWIVDDPSPHRADADPWRRVKIFGLDVAGRENQPPVIAKVRSQSAEAFAGLRPGQQIESVNGRPVRTVGELESLLAAHRSDLWLKVELAGGSPGIDIALPHDLPWSLPVHPTQIYSTIDGLLLCLLLLAYDPLRRRDGELVAIMMSVYPISRFLMERIRTDEQNILGTGMHISQNISLGLLLVGAGLWVYILRQPKRKWGVQSKE